MLEPKSGNWKENEARRGPTSAQSMLLQACPHATGLTGSEAKPKKAPVSTWADASKRMSCSKTVCLRQNSIPKTAAADSSIIIILTIPCGLVSLA